MPHRFRAGSSGTGAVVRGVTASGSGRESDSIASSTASTPGEKLCNAGILAVQPVKEIHLLNAGNAARVITAVQREAMHGAELPNPWLHRKKALVQLGLVEQIVV